jgi:hypothetical protein
MSAQTKTLRALITNYARAWQDYGAGKDTGQTVKTGQALENHIAAMEDERAELLAALRELLALNPHAIGTASARAAIAKATGGAA